MATHSFYIAVPNVYDGTFRITNVAWDDRLGDSSSDMHRIMATKIQAGLEAVLVPLEFRQQAEYHVSVKKLAPGSVVVHYRLSWLNVEGLDGPPQMTRDVTMRNFDYTLGLLDGLLGGIYDVADNSLSVNCKFPAGTHVM